MTLPPLPAHPHFLKSRPAASTRPTGGNGSSLYRPGNQRGLLAAFSFVEAIFTIAIIGIMSSIVVASISRVAADANRAVARNLQVSIQSALHQYVIDQTTNPATGRLRSMDAVRTDYNADGMDTMHRFNLLIPRPASGTEPARLGYLDQTTVDHILDYSEGQTAKLRSSALDNLGEWLELPDWEAGAEPTVIFRRAGT